MCKFKDTNLGFKKLDFNVKRSAEALSKTYSVKDLMRL